MSRAPITKTGSERLRAELDRLKSTERPRIIAAIAEARAPMAAYAFFFAHPKPISVY